jgi:ABC-type lipoprotein release transport system permease subunit
MTIWRVIFREIVYRKTNFLLSALAVLVAVGSVVAAISLLDRYAIRSEQSAAEQQVELKKKMDGLEDDYRKIALGLGFNIVILPKDQNLADFYAEDFASKLMPENYAEKLVQAHVVSINHVLPILQQKLKWPERERTIQLVGTRGEIALLAKGRRTALLDPVEAGHVVVGYELHRSLKLAVGDKIALSNRPLTVSALQPPRGNQDDITLWINLREAQQILGKEGRINAIQALECNCAADRLGQVRDEIRGILPDTQVIEFSSQALTRAEARNRAATEAREAIQRAQESRSAAARQRERLFALLAPLVIGACAVWAGLLALGNVRSRIGEIGILRALGVSTRRILAILLIRAALIGLLGAAIGFAAGWLGSWWGENRISAGSPLEALFDRRLLAMVLVLTPILSALISWLPAVWAAQLDPADSLKTGSTT